MSDRIDYRYNAEERVKRWPDDPKAIADELREQGAGLDAMTFKGMSVEGDTMRRAAATIDALVKEMHARELHHFEEEQRSVGFAAQLAKLSRLVGDGAPHWVLRRHISAVPADALAEHDARLIEGLAEKWDWDAVPAAAPPVRFWLESQASLIREGAQP